MNASSSSSPPPLCGVWTEERLRRQISRYEAEGRYRWACHSEALGRYRRAAVLVPLFVRDNDVHVWLTQRSQLVGSDKGHVAFPGGMRDPTDADELATSVREAHEEVGLSPDQVQCVACYLPRINSRQILLTPVVAIVQEDFCPRPNQEVSVAFSVPLRRFLSNEGHTAQDFHSPYDGKTYVVHFFTDVTGKDAVVADPEGGRGEGLEVTTWGLTAGVCVEIAVGLLQQETQFNYTADGGPLKPDDPFGYHKILLERLEDFSHDGSTKL